MPLRKVCPRTRSTPYVDPIVIQILNKARLYDQGKRVATVKKKAATKKKVLRSQKAPPDADNAKTRIRRKGTEQACAQTRR